MEPFKRKSPEQLLASIMKLHKGRLKIYVGAFSGSGKTYHMLQEGCTLKQQGVDVVICAVSTKQRPDTLKQIGDLERVPSIHWYQGEHEQKDLNLQGIIERNPEVVLVDQLAHLNREHAEFATRIEDIQFLLDQGISVITTVNIYELEDAMELARQWTGLEVFPTVPAHTLSMADEVRLIDVTPETILERMSDGRMQDMNPQWLNRGNLAKLRELALRLMAEDVNGTLEKHREEQGLVGTAGTAERILVSVQYYWNGSIYVRRGQQVAKRLGGDLRVVSFVNPKKPLSKEASAFRESIVQLTEKIGAEFEELTVRTRRHVPRRLMEVALAHNVTRIVMGHSRQSVWQDLWKGSVANQLLKGVRNIDLLFVADRSSNEGERILPTHTPLQENRIEPYRRLSPIEIEEKIGQMQRGRLKIYIGAAPGVGKTHTMLREGNDLLAKGIDVVIGLLETHGRAGTQAQVGQLTSIPRLCKEYKGTILEEMDLDSIIRRNPEVVLVDELAHTNIPGSMNRKRYEDVRTILDAGISVISTMNVQHLESLNDAVEQITGVRVRETVPDYMLSQSDEVQLIDVAPKALQERMIAGDIYAADKVGDALSGFFKIGNLIALRELALREIADDVDERLESWDRHVSLRGPWRRKEIIFVGISTGPHAERLIRRGFRIAYRLKAAWIVTYVHAGDELPECLEARIQALRSMTERLGGVFELQYTRIAREISTALIASANELFATQIIVGQSSKSVWKARISGTAVVRDILRYARHLDVLVVADFRPVVVG
ncbi:histidine kinase [Paenibacillus sp. strain BS8-2]